MTDRFSKAGLATACSALFIGSAILILPPVPADAAPARARSATEINSASDKLAQAEPAPTSSYAKATAEQPACDRPRRRLWVEGEGWVVRRVSACH